MPYLNETNHLFKRLSPRPSLSKVTSDIYEQIIDQERYKEILSSQSML